MGAEVVQTFCELRGWICSIGAIRLQNRVAAALDHLVASLKHLVVDGPFSGTGITRAETNRVDAALWIVDQLLEVRVWSEVQQQPHGKGRDIQVAAQLTDEGG